MKKKRKVKEVIHKNLFTIIHEVLATDTTEYSSTVIEAKTAIEALELFINTIHKENKAYYRYLRDPELKDVRSFKFYREA